MQFIENLLSKLKKQPPSIGVALGGGAAWGIAHIGLLRALEENNIPIHYISGTSIGALIGGLYASDISADQLSRFSTNIHWKELCRITLPLGGLLSNDPMEKFIYKIIGDKTFSSLKIPFVAIATDLISTEEVLIDSGKLSTAICASTSIPGIFHPVLLNNRTLVDGGVVNNVPVSILKKMGATFTIAVNLSPDFNNWHPKNSLEIILKSFLIMQNKVALKEIEQADVVIHINTKDFSPMNLKKSEELMHIGYEAGLSKIEEIHTLLNSKNFSIFKK